VVRFGAATGALQGETKPMSGGRKVFQPQGQVRRSGRRDGVQTRKASRRLAFIRLPERCANLCFGGPKNNRLYMNELAHSVYAAFTVEATARCN